MSALERWSCHRCGRYVAAKTVVLSDGAPYGTCPGDCAGQVLVRYTEPPRAAARSAALAGQEASLLSVDDVVRGAFFGVVEAVPVGQEVTVNDLRPQLNDLGVPPRVRGALFNAAIKAGLLAPARLGPGADSAAYTPSTGTSAHAARVRRYVRTAGVAS